MASTTAWTPAEDAYCRTLVEEGKSSAEIAALFATQGITRSQKAIMRRKERMGWHARIAHSPIMPMAGPMVAQGDMLILADPHCPLHDSDWTNRCIDLALKWRIPQAGLAGDLIDWSAFSHYGRRVGIEAEDEIRAAEQFTRTLARNFRDVYYCPGNHEQRLARTVGFAVDLDRLSQWWVTQPNIHTTVRKWFILESGGRKYRVIHPKRFGVTAPIPAARMASKYLMNIIAGHSHLWGIAHDVSGKFVGIDIGMCASRKLADYVEIETTPTPEMVLGACIVKDGVEYLLSPQNIAGYEALIGR